jgi:F-type H+-transporting ATPase subunit b
MGLDWSTFLLELVNFLILIWILKRFLYAPVRAAIEERRKRVEGTLTEAEATRAQAEQMRADYEVRRRDWERERAQARAELDRELAAERTRRLEDLHAEVALQRDKAAILEERKRREAERLSQETALDLAAAFGSRLLTRVADPALEDRLIDMVLDDLSTLSEEHRAVLTAAAAEGLAGVRVQSAYALSEARRETLRSALAEAAGRPLPCAFAEDPALVAGLQIDAGPLVMRANLRDELRFFAEAGQ